jgi:hypothetical protein
VISSNFYSWLIIFLFSYFYSEFLMSLTVHSIFKNIKIFTIQLTNNNKTAIFNNIPHALIINLLIMFFLTLKISIFNIFFSFIIIYLIINRYINKYIENYINFLNFNIIIFFNFLFFVNNYITFYILIELYAIIFYFFFLNINFNFKQLYLIQYKNSLLLYLFNNFLTSILYLIGVNYIIVFYGTVNFTELSFFNQFEGKWQIYFLILSFLLKLSLPGYHFLKIELYKYLTVSNVILFSVITLYINFLFTIFIFNQNLIFCTLNYFKVINLLILCGLFFFIHKLKISNFQEFVSYSGFATNNLILVNFLI